MLSSQRPEEVVLDLRGSSQQREPEIIEGGASRMLVPSWQEVPGRLRVYLEASNNNWQWLQWRRGALQEKGEGSRCAKPGDLRALRKKLQLATHGPRQAGDAGPSEATNSEKSSI